MSKLPVNAPRNAQELLRQAKRLMASDAYTKSHHPDSEQVRETVTALFKAAFPEGSVAPSDPNFTPQRS